MRKWVIVVIFKLNNFGLILNINISQIDSKNSNSIFNFETEIIVNKKKEKNYYIDDKNKNKSQMTLVTTT